MTPDTSGISFVDALRLGGLGAVALIAGVVGGAGFVTGYARAVLLALGAVSALVLVHVAATRIMTFALILLAIRASLDITNMQAGGRGSLSGLPATAVSVLLVVVTVLWVAAQRRRGAVVVSPLALAAIAVAAAGVVSVVGSIRPAATLIEAARVTSAMAMLVLLSALVRDAGRARRVLIACYLSLPVPIALGLFQAAGRGGAGNLEAISRVVGTFRHPNALGAYLAVLVVAGFALLHAARGRERWVLGALMTSGLVLLLLTYSRGSWLATIVGLMVVAATQRRPRLLVLLVVALAGASMIPSVGARVAELAEPRTLRGTGGNSLVWRIDYWRETLRYTGDESATGIGLDMAQYVTAEGNLPHNDFVRMYVEAGWFGLLSLLGLLAMLLITAIRAVRSSGNDVDRAIAAGFSGCLAVVFVIMMGGNVISSVVVLWYFSGFAACAHWVAGTRAADGSGPAWSWAR